MKKTHTFNKNIFSKPEIMADAAYAALSQPASSLTGQFLIDDTFLAEQGVTDFDVYQYDTCMLESDQKFRLKPTVFADFQPSSRTMIFSFPILTKIPFRSGSNRNNKQLKSTPSTAATVCLAKIFIQCCASRYFVAEVCRIKEIKRFERRRRIIQTRLLLQLVK